MKKVLNRTTAKAQKAGGQKKGGAPNHGDPGHETMAWASSPSSMSIIFSERASTV
jgi:hypothetical protein